MRAIVPALVVATCAGCDVAGARTAQAREVPPAILVVRQPVPGAASSPADGSEARPYPSLAAALAAAPAGALLQVDEGVFRERVVISRPVVLLGRGADRTRIVATDPAATAVEAHDADRVEIHGMAIEGGAVCASFAGGTHKLQNVELRGCSEAALVGRGANLEVVSSAISDVSGGRLGRGIDVEGGALLARRVSMYGAGRRAIVLHHARGLVEDAVVRWSSLSALQATAGADVRVVRGVFEVLGGAALYAGASRLRVEDARVRHAEYAALGYRGAKLDVLGGELTDYQVAGVAIVAAHGSVQRAVIARGGMDAGIAVTSADGGAPVLLVDNRISSPGTMGVHVTDSSVVARGNSITGAILDAGGDMGDALYAVDSTLLLEQNVMRGNLGSGVAARRSQVRLSGNGLIGNGRAGLLLVESSRATATDNTFEGNRAGIELAERARASVSQNRFSGNLRLDVDAGCEQGLRGTARIGPGNLVLAGLLRTRNCAP